MPQTFDELRRELEVCRAVNLEHLSEMDKLRKVAEDQNKEHLKYTTRLKEEIVSFEKAVEERENHLSRKSETIDNLTKTIDNLTKTIDGLTAYIKKLNERIHQSSTLVNILKVVLDEKED